MGFLGYFKRRSNVRLDAFWQNRIEIVTKAPDNNLIKHVPDAGKVKGDVQIMHNGVKIHVGSYYGDGATVLLNRNRGVHEPQEEKAFAEILSYLEPNSVMLELGSFWAFYSITFQKNVKLGINYLIEPDRHALLSGMHNFKLNGCSGKFFNYSVSDYSLVVDNEVETITVDEFLKRNNIKSLSILHSDIQGYELKMLRGASNSLKAAVVNFIFISTHSNELHEECKHFLMENNYLILCDANLDQSFSEDGVIVAKHNLVAGPEKIDIALRND